MQDIQQCFSPDVECESSNDANSDVEHSSEQVVFPQVETHTQPSQSTSTTPTGSKKRSPSQMLPPPQRSKSFKRLSSNKQSTRFENTVKKLQSIAELTTSDTEDQYDRFGNHIVSQLRELPLKSFILLQSKIQNLITEERLASLYATNSEPPSQSVISRQNSPVYQELQKTCSDSEATYYSDSSGFTCITEEEGQQEMNILNQALLSICDDPSSQMNDKE